MDTFLRNATSLRVLMAQRMMLCAKTWTWLNLSLEVIQKSQTVNVNNLTNMLYEKTYVCMSKQNFQIV